MYPTSEQPAPVSLEIRGSSALVLSIQFYYIDMSVLL